MNTEIKPSELDALFMKYGAKRQVVGANSWARELGDCVFTFQTLNHYISVVKTGDRQPYPLFYMFELRYVGLSDLEQLLDRCGFIRALKSY